VHIFVPGREALLDISSILLTAKNGYNSNGCWDLETKISRVQESFECIEETSSEDCVVRVEHVDDIKSDVLRARVLRGAE
jgi:hypothetical protein